MKPHLTILLAVALLLGSCAPRTPFTQYVREKYDLKEDDLKGIQFYTSHDIVLRKGEKSANNKETEDGTLILKNSKEIEEVVIRRGTPGTVVKVVDGNKIAVSFDMDDSKYLIFGDAENTKGNYKLLAAKWDKNKGTMKYGTDMYVVTPTTRYVHLQFVLKKLNSYRKKQTIAKGRKL